ncbi:serine/threonine protein kinase [Acetobacter senegalensis DSM 18889]|nr:serine/threonine protein kinase [Acetobacter senegalensis DSM 18889]
MLKAYKKAELSFELIKEIGQNGKNSKTFLVKDNQLNANIVSKQISKSSLKSPSEFFSESQALYASQHPNVVQIHYACYDNDYIYIAMPYYKNGSVKELIKNNQMTVRDIITIGAQSLSGLHNIHSKGLIHFDVKPDNILLSARKEALLSDFGLAKQMNYAGVAPQNRHYTPMIPPEAFETNTFDRTFDIYQMGLTLYRMCNGSGCFYDQLQQYYHNGKLDRAKFCDAVCNERFPDRHFFLEHIPTTLQKVIKKCLKSDPHQRYQSALDVVNAMAGIDGNNLDWRFERQSDKKLWTKNKEGTQYEFILTDDGNSICYKTVNGGTRRKVSAGCKTGMTDRELRGFFGDY